MKVKLKDPKKICWDRETDEVIVGAYEVTVEDTNFIRAKIKEGVLVEVPEEKSEQEATESETPEPVEETAKPAEAKPKKKK